MVEVDFEMEQPRGRRVWRAVRPIVVLLGLAAVWFLGVDWIHRVDVCRQCRHEADVFEYRVFGYVVNTKRRDIGSIHEYVLRDLGGPCGHREVFEWRRQRRWGLIVCACPCWTGVYRLTGGLDLNDFDSIDRSRVIAYGQSHSGILHAVQQNLREEDFASVWAIYDDMGFRANAEQE